MPNPITDRMEKMSKAYVAALCAANGYTFDVPSSDYDGIDCAINCPGYPCEDCGCVNESASLFAQLKSTYSRTEYRISRDGNIYYKLKVGNYNKLVKKRGIPAILILLILPNEDDSQWLEHSIECLKIKKCAYWVSLAGLEPSINRTTVTVKIPCVNALSSEELKRIMIKVSKEGRL